jgi:hypothetical protein
MGEASVDKRVGENLCLFNFFFFPRPDFFKSVGFQERQYRRLYADSQSPRYDHLAV